MTIETLDTMTVDLAKRSRERQTRQARTGTPHSIKPESEGERRMGVIIGNFQFDIDRTTSTKIELTVTDAVNPGTASTVTVNVGDKFILTDLAGSSYTYFSFIGTVNTSEVKYCSIAILEADPTVPPSWSVGVIDWDDTGGGGNGS